MDKIYAGFNDVHVRNYVVYGKSADKKLYYEPTYKTQVTKSDLVDAFDKGALVIVDGSSKLVPVVLTGNTVKTIGESSSALAFTTWAATTA